MNKILIGLVLFGASAIAQEMSFWSIQQNGIAPYGIPFQKTDTLIAGQMYFFGIEARVDQQKASLLSRGYTELSVWPGGSGGAVYAFMFRNGETLQLTTLNWGDGSRLIGQGGDNIQWQEQQGNTMNMSSISPSFDPINYMAKIFSSVGTYTINFTGESGATIWDANGTVTREPVSLSKTISVVPEPSSLSLLLAGGAVALSRRRKS